ncbi:MAG: DUF6612 family protein, partial [archaeon]
LSGCGAITDTNGDTGDVESIQSQALTAGENISTYDFRMETSAGGESESIEMNANGTVDNDERRMYMEMAVMGQEVTQYVDGETAYQNVTGIWRTQDLSEQDLWSERTVLQNQKELMESSEVTLEGTTTIDGTEVYVIRVDPGDEAIRTLLSQQSTGSDQLANADIQDVNLTQYVRTDDYHPKGSEVSLTVTDQGQTVEVAVQIILENFDRDVSITIPEEARDG